MTHHLSWEVDGADWPHRESSRFVESGGIRWHVQRMCTRGHGAPSVLLLHGTGASTHSWRSMTPLLAQHLDVLAIDLPGHGFTGAAAMSEMGIAGMSRSIAALMDTLGTKPAMLVGHSAGVAIASQLCLDARIQPQAIIGLNSALIPFEGIPGHVFSPMAKLLAATDWAPRLFSWRAGNPNVLRRLLDGTGSKLDEQGAHLYGKLMRSPGHAAAALAMMANWDLHALFARLDRLDCPLRLATGGRDKAIPQDHSARIVARVPGAVVKEFPLLGHLAHEEAPDEIAAWICDQAHVLGVR